MEVIKLVAKVDSPYRRPPRAYSQDSGTKSEKQAVRELLSVDSYSSVKTVSKSIASIKDLVFLKIETEKKEEE